MPKIPKQGFDLEQWAKGIDRRLSALETSNPLQRGATVTDGGLTVKGGAIRLVDEATGRTVGYFGQSTTVDGDPQMIFQLTRDDGSIAMALGDFGLIPGHPHQQALAIYDRAGNVVLADDTTSGLGLANPHLPVVVNMADTNTTHWPGTNQTAFTTVASGFLHRQNPRLVWSVQMYSPASVTGQWQMLLDGVQIGTTQTVAGGAGGTFFQWNGSTTLPGTLAVGSDALVELKGRVSAGTGTVLAQPLTFRGDQS